MLRTAVGALLVSSAVSCWGYAQAVPAAPTRDYLAAAGASLQQPTLNTGSPREVFGVFLYTPPFDTAEHTLTFAGVDGRWVTVTDEPFMLDALGARVPLHVDGESFDLVAECVPVADGAAFATPERRDPNWVTYEMDYQVTSDTVAQVRLGDSVLDVPLHTGDNTVYFAVSGQPASLVIRAPGACISAMTMGRAIPLR